MANETQQKKTELRRKFKNLLSRSDVQNSYLCSYKGIGSAPFDGPLVIIDESNPYCDSFANMYVAYQREFRDGERSDKKIKEMDIFLERMLRRECTEQEFRMWVNSARCRVEMGMEDSFLRSEYLRKIPEV